MLHKYEEEPGLWMNAQTAAARGLKSGELVQVTSEAGAIYVELIVTEAIRPDCVYMQPGYGHLSLGLKTAYGLGASDSPSP